MAQSSAAPEVESVDAQPRLRRIFLVWQNAETRLFSPVGALVHDPASGFVFRYIEHARHLAGFRPLVAFPDLDGVYGSATLPAFFENRLMSPRRPEYQGLVSALDLDIESATPFEVLARTGGGRATDTFNLVAEPEIDEYGHAVLIFLAHGIRYLEGAEARIELLQPGDLLELRQEHGNPVNSRALLLDVQRDSPVGYVPDWMVDCVHELSAGDPDLQVRVELVNGPHVPRHLRLLCRLEANLTDGYRPFSGPEFAYLH